MRSTLFLLAIATALCLAPAALAADAPALAGSGTEFEASLGQSEADLCPASVTPAAEALPLAGPIGPPTYVLCSCELCKEHPEVVCRISPTGYSIRCKDYYNLNC